jgi:hypothetical protein
MLQSIWGVVRGGKVEMLEPAALPEGAKVLVTVVPADEEQRFWQQASHESLKALWDNPQDDVYAQLLAK